MVASGLAFVLLVAGLWIDSDGDGFWQAWGIASLMALWGSHASVVLRPLRASDSTAIRWLSATAIVALGIDAWIGVLAILEVFDDAASDPMQRTLAATVVLTLHFVAAHIVNNAANMTAKDALAIALAGPAASLLGSSSARGRGISIAAACSAICSGRPPSRASSDAC